MPGTNRGHALINANVDDVWAVVGDPRTHPDWWPEVIDVTVPAHLGDGDEYVRKVRRYNFLDLVDNVWVAERLEHLREAHYRCTASGAYARFALTPARDDTFVELETGLLPQGATWKVYDAIGRPGFTRWAHQLLDALPTAVERHRAP
ncbi:MAG TPA: SRPBCC family protein [Solirubrobacteraceae bacterium]|nr:SRPBCC family protein [Solirubrobacteraceae bacterium]